MIDSKDKHVNPATYVYPDVANTNTGDIRDLAGLSESEYPLGGYPFAFPTQNYIFNPSRKVYTTPGIFGGVNIKNYATNSIAHSWETGTWTAVTTALPILINRLLSVRYLFAAPATKTTLLPSQIRINGNVLEFEMNNIDNLPAASAYDIILIEYI